VTLPRKHLHTLPSGPTLPDATANEEGFPFLLETVNGQTTVRTLYQAQGGTWTGIVVTPAPAQMVTADYTLTPADVGRNLDANGDAALTITVPLSTTTALPIGATVTLTNLSSNQVQVVGADGVTIHGYASATMLNGAYAVGQLRQVDTDVWLLTGQVTD
jgi:hypothetical protein